MYKFDVKYKFEDYLEYYKYALIKSKMWRDILFAIMFIGVGIYWLLSKQSNTYVAYCCFVFGILIPLWSLISFPLIKRQLRANLPVIEKTHLVVTFTEDEIIYENLSADANKVENEKDEPKEEVNETEIKEEQEKAADETTNLEGNETKEDETPSENEEKKDENVFKLKYNNFQLVREISNLIVFYLDRQTIVILPKETLVDGMSIDDFKTFVLTKIPTNRVKFLKK